MFARELHASKFLFSWREEIRVQSKLSFVATFAVHTFSLRQDAHFTSLSVESNLLFRLVKGQLAHKSSFNCTGIAILLKEKNSGEKKSPDSPQPPLLHPSSPYYDGKGVGRERGSFNFLASPVGKVPSSVEGRGRGLYVPSGCLPLYF